MADGEFTGQLLQSGLTKNFGGQPHTLMLVNLTAVGTDNAGGFLAAMLEGEKAEKGYAGGIFMAVNRKNTAFFAGINVSIASVHI